MAGKTSGKHPLNCAWSIWEHREDGESYADCLHKLCTFSTVEEFWGYFNNIPKPSEILFDGTSRRKFVNRSVQSFSVFKDGIKPEWEDPMNSSGGEWYVRKRMSPEDINDCWDKLILGLIGETIDPSDEVTGVRIVYKSRKDQMPFRFEIWLRSRDRDMADKVRGGVMDCINGNDNKMHMMARDFVYKEHSAA